MPAFVLHTLPRRRIDGSITAGSCVAWASAEGGVDTCGAGSSARDMAVQERSMDAAANRHRKQGLKPKEARRPDEVFMNGRLPRSTCSAIEKGSAAVRGVTSRAWCRASRNKPRWLRGVKTKARPIRLPSDKNEAESLFLCWGRRGTTGWLEREDHVRFMTCCGGDGKSSQHEGRCDHVTHAANFTLRPVTGFPPTFQLRKNLMTEFEQNGRHGFRRQVWPQFVGFAEQSHERAGLFIHMQDAAGRRQDHDAGV